MSLSKTIHHFGLQAFSVPEKGAGERVALRRKQTSVLEFIHRTCHRTVVSPYHEVQLDDGTDTGTG